MVILIIAIIMVILIILQFRAVMASLCIRCKDEPDDAGLLWERCPFLLAPGMSAAWRNNMSK